MSVYRTIGPLVIQVFQKREILKKAVSGRCCMGILLSLHLNGYYSNTTQILLFCCFFFLIEGLGQHMKILSCYKICHLISISITHNVQVV